MISQKKQCLRQDIRSRLRTLSKEQRTRESKVICQQLRQLPCFQNARTIAAFCPMVEEPDIWSLLCEGSHIYCFPRWEVSEMRFYTCHVDELSLGTQNILLPPSKAVEIDPAVLDLVLVPGLAFSVKGERLGRGGGYYDRFLAKVSVPTIGLAFSVQRVEEIPTEPFDQCIDQVIFGDSFGEK